MWNFFVNIVNYLYFGLRLLKRWTGASGDEETFDQWMNAVSEEDFLNFLAQIFLISAIPTFFLLQKWSANYGRYSAEAWFSQYLLNSRFAWFIQEAPSLVAPMLALYWYGEQLNLSRFLAFAMFAGHYFQRTMIYPFLMSGGKKSPPHIVGAAFIFCATNGYMQAFYHVQYAPFADDHCRSLVSQAGFIIFLTGMVINIHSDSILRNLRKAGEKGYKQRC
uniref:S5A_REDUCTASE domain-containing protein n=1 Tax=Panagrellus redivivus TaxID=6233 RepID=A0A7E4UPE3_PANRE